LGNHLLKASSQIDIPLTFHLLALAKIYDSGQIKTYIQEQRCFLEIKFTKRGQKTKKDMSDVKNAELIGVLKI